LFVFILHPRFIESAPFPEAHGPLYRLSAAADMYERTIPDILSTTHPCLRCGACCAVYRVAFHWLELEEGAGVPEELTQRLDAHRLEMRKRPDGRCLALSGQIGQSTACTIYERRPSVCRELLPAWEHGEPSPQCDRARQRFGLSPLSPADWHPVAKPQSSD
jgi:Fe-S-cluster containining protein